jgi:hypothetical protein
MIPPLRNLIEECAFARLTDHAISCRSRGSGRHLSEITDDAQWRGLRQVSITALTLLQVRAESSLSIAPHRAAACDTTAFTALARRIHLTGGRR